MEDIVQATGVIAVTAGQIGMTRDELGKSRELLQKYGDERDRLFDQMVSLLSKSDTNDITDDWKKLCEKGNELLEDLNGETPKSSTGEGLIGMGARDFYEGEKKMWAENGKAQLALVADVLARVIAANSRLIEQCNENLKSIQDGDAEVQTSFNDDLEEIKNNVIDVVNTLNGKLGDKSLTAWLKEGGSKNYMGKWSETLAQRAEDILKGAQQKGALKKQILDKIDTLGSAKEQLDEKWIEDMYRSGEDCAKSLPGCGETGDYRALDWAKFGESCTSLLGETRDAAKEKSQTVFSEILPSFVEEKNTRFAALTDDPSHMADWKSDLQDKQESIEAMLVTEDEVIKDLAEGPYQEAARENFDDLKQIFSDGMKSLFEKIKDAEDLLRI
jgi:hypothetical protein